MSADEYGYPVHEEPEQEPDTNCGPGMIEEKPQVLPEDPRAVEIIRRLEAKIAGLEYENTRLNAELASLNHWIGARM